MAEIKIERKSSKRPIWPWILGLALLLGLIWLMAEVTEDPVTRELGAQEPYPVVPETMTNRPAGGEADAFVSFVQDSEVQDRLGVSHVLISEALMRLSLALEDLAGPEQDFRQQIYEIRTSAEQMQGESSPTDQRKADLAHNAFNSATHILEQLQREYFPNAESALEDVREQLSKMNAAQPLHDQQDEVQEFFEKVADTVEKMQQEKNDQVENQGGS
jgi:hypothetical protein